MQALSHVREFRECILSDEAGVSLYAAGKANGSSAREPNPTPADEILSFPGFKKRRKRKKGETREEVEETTVVPVRECLHKTIPWKKRSVQPALLDACALPPSVER